MLKKPKVPSDAVGPLQFLIVRFICFYAAEGGIDAKEHEFFWEQEMHEKREEFFAAVDFLRTLQLTDTEFLLNDLLRQGKRILAEGAQGSLLDIDFGTYPYVTSSSTIAAGACTGLGIAPQHIQQVFGITKAYCTRVGSGPFPTELHDETGEQIRQAGREFGSTTGRPRRTGWIDLPALRYAIMLNGVTELHLMKADVLDDFATIQACTHYRLPDGIRTPHLPDPGQLGTVTPEYLTLPGWHPPLTTITEAAAFPAPLQAYLAFLEKELQVPVRIVSVGPDRVSTIMR